jgi:hypothetical protein
MMVGGDFLVWNPKGGIGFVRGLLTRLIVIAGTDPRSHIKLYYSWAFGVGVNETADK